MRATTILNLATVTTSMLLAGSALGKAELLCNKKQTKCVTESHALTIGDRVGVFNDDGELVATGEVDAMRGERRAVLIEKRTGVIRKGYNLALLKQEDLESGAHALKLYKEPAKVAVGASGGLANVSVGEGAAASEISVFGQWRKWGGIQVVGRGVYLGVEGEVSRYADLTGLESRPISMTGLGLLGGAAYVLRENKPLSFRGELGLGLVHVSATIDGDASLVEDGGFRTNIHNGVGPYGRLALGAMLNVSERWHVHGDFAASLVQKALAKTIAAGVSMDLK